MKSKKHEYIRTRVPAEESLAQLAEEAIELAHAALKMRRALGRTNPTPLSSVEALARLKEEVADVLLLLEVLGIDGNPEEYERIKDYKLQRWVDRLQSAEKGLRV